MEITLNKVELEEKSVLRNLLELYLYDFTEYSPGDVNEHGLYGYTRLDHYWTEEGRHPYFIRVNGKLAGFALVREVGMTDTNETIYSIAEFFVMKQYRHGGVGRTIAYQLFDTFGGVWRVAQIEKNVLAQIFWRKVIGEYTGGNYEEVTESGWIGSIQQFRVAGNGSREK